MRYLTFKVEKYEKIDIFDSQKLSIINLMQAHTFINKPIFFKVPSRAYQVEAQPHNTNNVTALLNQESDYWIENKRQTLGPVTGEREEQIKWPARSPDITPMDFGY